MPKPEKEINRMEVLHLMGEIYADTAVGFCRTNICKRIAKYETLKKRRPHVTRAFLTSGLLQREGIKTGARYKWNLKDYGPPSLILVDMIIYETRNQQRIKLKEFRNRQHLDRQ